MTDCAICGREAVTKAYVEGAFLDVCANCVSYGREAKSSAIARGAQKPEMVTELADGFEKTISRARASRGESIEQLASRISVNADYLKQVEAGRRHLDQRTAEKIEKGLSIKILTQSVESAGVEVQQKIQAGGFTLGDIAVIKRDKK